DFDINKKIEVKGNTLLIKDVDLTKIDVEKLLKLWLNLYVNNSNNQEEKNIIFPGGGDHNNIQISNEQGLGDVIQK
ncbi:MAG TPA: hypothetical protein VF941_16015, partial [Clostridia bacterium]